MDVASGPLYRHAPENQSAGVRIGARIALTLLILAGLCLLVILASTIASLPPEPASERMLIAPLRWT